MIFLREGFIKFNIMSYKKINKEELFMEINQELDSEQISRSSAMQFEDAGDEIYGDENIQQMLDDLALEDNNSVIQTYKSDATMFVIDVCPELLIPLQGQKMTELEKIFQGYANFMMTKIIANASDKVGLILCNVKKNNNSLNFQYINTVHPLSPPSALTIKAANNLFKDFENRFGISQKKASLHNVFWLYNHEMKDILSSKYHLRMFYFTADDCPHPIGDDQRDQSINHARQLAQKGVLIQLFPLRKHKRDTFDIKKFFHQILTFDPDDINQTIMDGSSKIMDLQARLRQKQFKKRTLNRLLMKIGEDTEVGIKVYSGFSKAKKPIAKKVDAKSNKPLQRVTKKMNTKGQALFDGQIGTYYPLGGQRIRLSKEDMNKIKNIESPGMTLVGFKPKSYIKPYYNLRTSYFLYPDEQYVTGSSQFFDALITQMISKNLVGIVKIVPRANQQLRFAALFPQQQSYDQEDHFQTPPGFHMIFLPFADDIANFTGGKTVVQPASISSQLVQVTKLLINNLTIHDFDFRNFQNPSLQKFYSHLQAHALNELTVEQRTDLLKPDYEGFNRFKDVIDLVKETVEADLKMLPNKKQQHEQTQNTTSKGTKQKQQKGKQEKQEKSNQKDEKKTVKKTRAKKVQKKQIKEQEQKKGQEDGMVENIEKLIMNSDFKGLKIAELRSYLKHFDLETIGKKEELIDRIITFMSHKNQI